MIPVARTANILITEVDNEVMIYDRETDACHCLNPIATKVYYYADGRNTVDDIATFLKQELELSEDVDIRGLIWLALEELERCHLIQEYVREPIADEVGVSRRKVLGKTAKFAGAVAIGALFPMVQSVVAPKPAMASSSPTPTPTPTPTPYNCVSPKCYKKNQVFYSQVSTNCTLGFRCQSGCDAGEAYAYCVSAQ